MSLNKREHDLWYPVLINRDKEICCNCGKTPRAIKPELYVNRLLIHEVEYKRPLEGELLKLICDPCNQLIHPQKQEKLKGELTPQIAINRAKEGPSRSYIINRVLLDGECNTRQLTNATAEKMGVSIKTCETYLDKLTSDEGPLIEYFDQVYLRGYEPEVKYDFMSNSWITVKEAKKITPEIVKEIQSTILISK